MSREVEDLSFFDIVQQYRTIDGRVIGVTDAVVSLAMAAGGFWVASQMPTPNFMALSKSVGPILIGLAGTLLGISLAVVAVTVSLMSTSWLGKLRRAGGFPALVMPYWATAVAWTAVIFLGLGTNILTSFYVPRSDLLTVPLHDLAIGLVTADFAFVGLATSLSLSLFGSLVRIIGLKLDTDDPPSDRPLVACPRVFVEDDNRTKHRR